MEIKCPICGEAVELPETMIGVKVRCPLCEGVFMAEDEEIFLLQPARSYAIVAAGSAENGVVECSDPNGLIKWRYPEINGEIWIDGVLDQKYGGIQESPDCPKCKENLKNLIKEVMYENNK